MSDQLVRARLTAMLALASDEVVVRSRTIYGRTRVRLLVLGGKVDVWLDSAKVVPQLDSAMGLRAVMDRATQAQAVVTLDALVREALARHPAPEAP